MARLADHARGRQFEPEDEQGHPQPSSGEHQVFYGAFYSFVELMQIKCFVE